MGTEITESETNFTDRKAPGNPFEEKQERRRARYQAKAEKAQSRSDGYYGAASEITNRIPPGQPVLVGHHSEKRHRRELSKIDSNMQKSATERQKSDYYAQKAASVGRGGISADDPDALDKLYEKLKGLEHERDVMKKANAQFRKGGFDAVKNLSEECKMGLKKHMEKSWVDKKRLFPSYTLSNLGANIRRIKKRIQELEALQENLPMDDISGSCWTITEDRDENRFFLTFDRQIDKGVWLKIKRHYAWNWSRTLGAFSRKITVNSRTSVDMVSKYLRDTLG